MTLPDRFVQLLAHEELADLLARFDNAVIRDDRDSFQELWTEDGEWEISARVPMRAPSVAADRRQERTRPGCAPPFDQGTR